MSATKDATTATVAPGALALVLDELDNLPLVDDRYRVWPWSLRKVARRRRCSPGTVHKHLRSLRAAGVLVDDDMSRTLVDTARLRLDGSTTGHRRRSGTPTGRTRALPSEPAATRPSGDVDVLAAIEGLTCAVEAHTEHSGVLLAIIERLARLLVDDPSDQASGHPARPGVDLSARGRAVTDADARAADQPERSAGTDPEPRAEERAIARSSKKEREKDLSRCRARDAHLPGLSFSLAERSRDGARDDRARAGARSAEQLLELLEPLEPARHVTYLEGVRTALAGYDDDQVAHAVSRIARLGDVATNPVGLLVDRATSHDPVYFPTAVPRPSPVPAKGGAGDLPDLWSSAPAPAPADTDVGELPELDPDATLAARLAARTALEAARQPVTPAQLAARLEPETAAAANDARATWEAA
jgi:hypothetical protein